MMKKLGNKIIEIILKYSLAVIIVTALITGGALYLLPKIKFDNSVDAFFDKKSKSYINFQAWKEQFGSDDVIIVAFSNQDIFTAPTIFGISNLTAKFEQLKYVRKVTSLTNINDIVGADQDFIVQPLVVMNAASRQMPMFLERLRTRTLANPLYVKNVISTDGRTTAIAIELEHRTTGGDAYKKETIQAVQKILATRFPKGRQYYLSGPTAIEYFYASYMQQDFRKFLPIILAIIVAVLIFSFRGAIGVLLPMLVVGLSLVWTMALLYLCGYSINNVTTIIPPIMLSITLLEAIHFVWELIQRKGKETLSPQQAEQLIGQTIRHLFVPCFLTNVTTVIGFFSLLVTNVPPIRQLGWVSGMGVFFAYIITFTFLPALIKQFNLLNYLSHQQTESKFRQIFEGALEWLTTFSDKFKFAILAVTFVLMGLAVWGTTRIKTETSVLEYFRKRSTIYQATNFVEHNLTGVHFLNISLRSPKLDYFKDPQALQKIQRLQVFLSSFPEIDKTTSVVDYLKEINKAFHNEDASFHKLPESRNLVAQYLLLYGATDLQDYVNSDWDWTTVRIRLKEHSTAKLKKIIYRIERYLNSNLDETLLKSEALGQTVLEVNANEAVTSGQVQSLTFAMVMIFGMMFLDFRSFALGTISMAPNVFPLLLNFGIMGWMGIRLDSVTSMVSDIGIGIIVDDTIHFYHAFGEAVKEGGDYRRALHKSFVTKGAPTIITSIILILGFGVVMFSNFVPTFYFGMLSSLLIFNGLFSELMLNPALLMLFKPRVP